MFNKLKTVKAFSNDVILLDELINLVRNNPQKDIINKIRQVEYKSKDYNNLKLKLSCITPHGIFNSLCNDGLIKVSNYLYFDIDGFDTIEQLNDTKQKLIDTFPICFLCKSVGGRGISFFIKVSDTQNITNDTFGIVYSFVRSQLLNLGFNIDSAASGLVRKMIISYDLDVYHSDNELIINEEYLNDYVVKSSNNLRKIETKRRDYYIEVDDTLIPFEELIKQIKLEVEYTKEITNEFCIEEIDYYRILIPKMISDGNKHKIYTRMINALYYLNASISRIQVLSFINYINNNHTTQKMNFNRLKTYVNYICENIESTGEVKLKTRKKKLHFNKNINLTKKEKQSMAAKILNKERGNKTLKMIEEAKLKCAKDNVIPTQRMIMEMTGLSIATIKRNWNKTSQDLEITFETKKVIESSITEDNFFNDVDNQKEIIIEPVKDMIELEYNYKGIEKVKLQITKEDKEYFKKLLEILNNKPSESLLLDFGWNKYKTDYLYNKWLQKNKHKYYGIETE